CILYRSSRAYCLIDEMDWTKEQVKEVKPCQTLVIECGDAAELNSSWQTAYQARRELGYDKTTMRISQSYVSMKVEVELKRGGER
ncbi:MAG: hypothetical protein K2K97_02010, partial [Muribaculaceae bacterium]|nr:hypothetical protein [Muribaculaceae bacterium]